MEYLSNSKSITKISPKIFNFEYIKFKKCDLQNLNKKIKKNFRTYNLMTYSRYYLPNTTYFGDWKLNKLEAIDFLL